MKKNILQWKNNFRKGKEIVMCSASQKGRPNGIIVISLGFFDDKLLIADCQMKTTIKNLKRNNSLCVIGGYIKILGKVKIFDEGKYFDKAQKLSGEYKVKNAILITPQKIIDLDKVKLLHSC